MAANTDTHRPLSLRDRIKLNHLKSLITSRYHSVRSAAHREMAKLLAKYEHGRRRGLQFAPAFRSDPRRSREQAPLRNMRAAWSWIRLGYQRARDPGITRAEIREGIRDEHGRLIDQDQLGNGRHRAQQSRDHFEGNGRPDNRGQQDRRQRDGDRARERQDDRSRDDDRGQRETGDGGNRDQRDVPPQREQPANGRGVNVTTDVGAGAWERPVSAGMIAHRTEQGYRVDSPVPLTREQVAALGRDAAETQARQDRGESTSFQTHNTGMERTGLRETGDTPAGRDDRDRMDQGRDEAPAARDTSRDEASSRDQDSHFVGLDRVGMPGEDLSRDTGHDTRDTLNGGRDDGHDALGAGRSEPAASGHDSGR